MSGIDPLLKGFEKFRSRYFQKDPELYQRLLKEGQTPRFAIIACSDSRVDPALVLQVEPGDIFAIRNVAALVPPFEDDGHYHGTSAALEYAVRVLKVDHIIVIGHAHCGGVAAMVDRQDCLEQATASTPNECDETSGTFITAWTNMLRDARKRVLAQTPELKGDALLEACERQGVQLSLDNLMTFPFINSAVATGHLQLHGWYLNIYDGILQAYDPKTNTFTPIG